jgi:site-specific DNA-adenine methylase
MAYPGGKNGAGVYQRIISLMPPHKTYIEPFLGGGAIMRLKRPAALNIGIDRDPEVIRSFIVKNDDSDRLSARLLIADALDFMSSYPFEGRELVYCDPPYVHSTRAARTLYQFEMSDDDHRALLDIIKGLPCMVMISGYWSLLYADALQSWQVTTFEAMTRGGTMATEYLWMNFPAPVQLHDYAYLGDGYRERERIKRKINRWVSRLDALPLLERQALMAALSRLSITVKDSPE